MHKNFHMAFNERRSKDGAIRKRPDISRCTRHPKHRQAPGVCSLCLHEKLSKICSVSSRSSSSSSSSSSSFSSLLRMQYYDYSSGSSSSSSISPSSSSGSSTASPVHRYQFDRNALVKSRFIAFAPRRKRREVNGSVKLGFWSKLISLRQGETTRNKDGVDMSGLKFSKTVRER